MKINPTSIKTTRRMGGRLEAASIRRGWFICSRSLGRLETRPARLKSTSREFEL
jgi:hypothetical protein